MMMNSLSAMLCTTTDVPLLASVGQSIVNYMLSTL